MNEFKPTLIEPNTTNWVKYVVVSYEVWQWCSDPGSIKYLPSTNCNVYFKSVCINYSIFIYSILKIQHVYGINLNNAKSFEVG